MPIPGISVLITYHNEGELLTRCLKSFLNQPILEILIFDDASDLLPEKFIPSSDLLKSIGVRIVRSEENVGPARGRNRLLQEARGEFVHFHDSDDWVMPEWGTEVVNLLKTGVDAVFTEVSSYRSGSLSVEYVQELRFIDVKDPLRFAISHFLLVPSGTYRKSCVERMGGYSDLWQSEDYHFHIRFMVDRPRVSAVLTPLVGIDLRSTSRSTRTVEVWCCTLDVLKRMAMEVDPRYFGEISSMAYYAGMILFRAKSPEDAREAFRFSQSIGNPKIVVKNRLYQMIARVSPMMAERASFLYRVLKGK